MREVHRLGRRGTRAAQAGEERAPLRPAREVRRSGQRGTSTAYAGEAVAYRWTIRLRTLWAAGERGRLRSQVR